MNFLRSTTVAALIVSATVSAHAQTSPGRAALEKMHAAYAGKWYKTLTFIQKSTFITPGSPDRNQDWWESLRYTPRHGVQLRIDTGDLEAGNGSLSTADSTWIFRSGALAQTRGTGNEFLPWIEGVYVQPLDVTERQVKAMGVDLAKTRKATWRGRPVTVIGAAAAEDTTHSQAWIDDERQVVVRMIVATPTGRTLDVYIDEYVRTGGGWLGTKIDILIDGVLRQREVYTEWKVDVELPESLFDVTQWKTAPHWGRPTKR